MTTNSFGEKIFEPSEVLHDPNVSGTVTSMLYPVLGHLGLSSKETENVTRRSLMHAYHESIDNYEKHAHAVLEEVGVTRLIPKKLEDRAKKIISQISPHLVKGTVLDFGCGDGRVGELLRQQGYKVNLTDVYQNPHIKDTGLDFQLFQQGEDIPFGDNQFDNTLALTVYHHCNDPMKGISECARVTRPSGKVLVIESVFGVNGVGLDKDSQILNKDYLSLTPEQQRRVNIFFDHFYNRVVHYDSDPTKKVNVPFNFNTPENWKNLFEEYKMSQERVIHLGVDQPVVPEYHTLHVLQVK